MSSALQDLTIEKFLTFYRDDLDADAIDDRNVILSFPLHFSGSHRVEVTITQINEDHFVISDGAKTIEELKSAGYSFGTKLRQRLMNISRAARIRVVDDYLVADSDAASLGSSLQRFVEAAKTIGDAYLVQRPPAPKDENLVSAVTEFLLRQSVPFQTKKALDGKVERHSVDFLFPPNGVPGLALSIMGTPTRMAAEAWAFKSSDIKSHDSRMKVGIVYEESVVSNTSKKILNNSSVDISVPSSDLNLIALEMQAIGILKGV